MMHISQDYGSVRIISEGSPFDVTYDIRVQWKRNGEWEDFWGTNSLSDDYAYSNARDRAAEAAKVLASL
ncbi:MAG: hypothetical protein EBU08_05860 [Micrococcales bacterium]|nr:hypothetical protein [Micrococcales bacterium]